MVGLTGAFHSLLIAQEVRLGPVDVKRSDANEVQIRRGDDLWRVDLSKLVRRNDCASLDEIGKATCPGRPTMPCPDCPRGVGFIAWDDRHQKLYFAISTGRSRNNPWTIFNYSIGTHRVARFTNAWAADLQRGVVSPSGRYLAYVNIYHGGYCANSEAIEVVDLWDRRVATLRTSSTDIATIARIDWSSNTVVQFEGVKQSESDCSNEKSPERLTGSVNVSLAAFR
jgi:hypothetical protein